jgi:NAD+ diphosphatase
MRPADAAPNLAPPHIYAGGTLDRAAERRGDEVWLAERRADPASRVVVLLPDLRVPVSGPEDRPRVAAPSVEALDRPAAQDSTLLGLRDGVAWFAEADEDEPACDTAPESRRHVDLRTAGTVLPSDEAALLAYARAILHWQARSSYCPVCGNPARLVHAGHVRRCVGGCGADHFPRTDPAVIVLVTSGDRCLLGRSPRFPPGMYSTLAGLRGAGRVAGGDGPARDPGGERRRGRGRGLPLLPALAVPAVADAGLRARARTTELRIDREDSRTPAGSPVRNSSATPTAAR